jgi:hypothetical protein
LGFSVVGVGRRIIFATVNLGFGNGFFGSVCAGVDELTQRFGFWFGIDESSAVSELWEIVAVYHGDVWVLVWRGFVAWKEFYVFLVHSGTFCVQGFFFFCSTVFGFDER